LKKALIIIVNLCACGYLLNNAYSSIYPFRNFVDTNIATYFIDPVGVDSSVTTEIVPEPKPKSKTVAKQKKLPPSQFARIDKHAANTPKKYEKSLSELANYLVIPAANETEKVRSLFSWIAFHIKYDDEEYNANAIKSYNAQEIINRKKGVCDGYSTLLSALCEEAGLQSKKIIGYAKGYGYSPGRKFDDTNHAWNAVKIDGQWKLMDATWASGYGKAKNGKMVSISRFDEYWFDVDSREFIFTHLPEEQKWQFTPDLISLPRYEQLPNVGKAFFKNGFNSDYVYQKSMDGSIQNYADVYRTDFPINIIKLPYRNTMNEGSTYNMEVHSEYAEEIVVINNGKWNSFTKDGSTFTLQCIPEAGDLSISIKFNKNVRNYSTFVRYKVISKSQTS